MIQVRNSTRGVVLAQRADVANTLWKALVGLIPYRRLEAGGGMLLPGVGSIHTTGLRFSIDVIFINKASDVIGLRRDVLPFRIAWAPRGTHSAVELPAGTVTLESCGIGDRLAFTPVLELPAE
jgi:uncharacterized protein